MRVLSGKHARFVSILPGYHEPELSRSITYIRAGDHARWEALVIPLFELDHASAYYSYFHDGERLEHTANLRYLFTLALMDFRGYIQEHRQVFIRTCKRIYHQHPFLHNTYVASVYIEYVARVNATVNMKCTFSTERAR